MEFVDTILKQIWGFFSLDGLIEIIKSGNYESLLTYEGMRGAIAPLLPVILILELIRGLFYKHFNVVSYKISFFSYVLNSIIGRYLAIGMTIICIGIFEKYAIINIQFTWYWFIYGYIIWELAHFVYHYFGHKVRLFWCLHSTHHAPESMNLAVSHAHFFLEAPYADVIRTTICMLMGVPPAMLFVIMFIDGTWGSFIHIGESMMKNGRMGMLGKYILTPSHHRVHHAKNIEYMDMNYCNLLNIWDKVFKTYQPERDDIKIQYGITRQMKRNSFLDSYFGEITALAKDVYRAPGIKNKVLYIFMPPGWSHTGEHKTVGALRKTAELGNGS